MYPRQRVLVADGSKYFDRSIWRMLIPEPEFDIVGMASNTDEAIEMAGALIPDIILADLSHSEMRGLRTIEILHRTHPTIPIISLSPISSQEYSQAALKAGATVCVTKSEMAETLAQTLQALNNGQARVMTN
jgi:DNA-binding NarL/FixJ family response regulator